MKKQQTDEDFAEFMKENLGNQFSIAMVNIIRAIEHEQIQPGAEVSQSLGEVEIKGIKYQIHVSLTSNEQQFIGPMDISVSETVVTNPMAMLKTKSHYDIN